MQKIRREVKRIVCLEEIYEVQSQYFREIKENSTNRFMGVKRGEPRIKDSCR